MKKIILLIQLILIYHLSLAQFSLEVNLKDCKHNDLNDPFIHLSDFELFRNDTLIKTVKSKNEKKHIIKDLPFGKYRIDYKTIFNKIESVTIETIDKKNYSVDLCINYLNYQEETYIPFIDRLKNGENYSINIYNQGCFHNSTEKIFITRKKNILFAHYNKEKRILTESEIELVRRFELELNYMESEGCTSTTTYKLQYKSKKINITDGTCHWYGLFDLKKSLDWLKE